MILDFIAEYISDDQRCCRDWRTIAASLLIVYLTILRLARWKHQRHLDAQIPSDIIANLRTAHAIHVDTIHRDQYYFSRKAVELGMLKTFAIPSISKLLAATGEFRDRTETRSEDVDLLVSEFLEHCPLDSSRARLAIGRMNAIHSKYKIANEDYVYVLCVFACQAIMWIDENAWRNVHPNEKIAVSFHYYVYVGDGT